MKFWKKHPALRMTLMPSLFVLGMALLIIGWKMTGKLSGLFIMLVGIVLLLTCLAIYNKPFQDPKPKKKPTKENSHEH